ncbi:MAG: hypothetical protein Q8K60_09085 [Parachlamydiaceae bacterium]|nr:hypothetical protein [Parachlamydiaceae bacterium]
MNLVSQCLKCFGYVKEDVDFENDTIPEIDLEIVDLANDIIEEIIQTQDEYEYIKIYKSKRFFRLIYEILIDKNERNIDQEINEFINSKLKYL